MDGVIFKFLFLFILGCGLLAIVLAFIYYIASWFYHKYLSDTAKNKNELEILKEQLEEELAKVRNAH